MNREQADRGGPTLRTQRLRLTWLLALPFLFLARPSPGLILAGGGVAAFGLFLRAFAAGFIHKDQWLATGGPFGHMRHPLYLGSSLVGAGLSLAGGRWWFPPVFAVLFSWVYRRTVRAEEEHLTLLFGEAYREYRDEVPPFIPLLSRPSSLPPCSGFKAELYLRNKEWQALLGAALGFVALWAKMLLSG